MVDITSKDLDENKIVKSLKGLGLEGGENEQ